MKITARCNNGECVEYGRSNSVNIKDSDIPGSYGEPVYYIYKCPRCGAEVTVALEVIADDQ